MYYDELKMYCKSEGLSEYLLSEMKFDSLRKETAPVKAKKQDTDKKDPNPLKRAAC